MSAFIMAKETNNPTLTRAVLRRVDREQLRDVATHGADAGWSGFTYYTDTCAFYRKHRKAIMQRLAEDAESMGTDWLEMVAGFRCLKGLELTPSQVSAACYGEGEEDVRTQVENALTWYVLEAVALELNPDL